MGNTGVGVTETEESWAVLAISLFLAVGVICPLPQAPTAVTSSLYLFYGFCLFVCLERLFVCDSVSLCSPGCLRTCSVDQAGLKIQLHQLPHC